MFCPPQAIHLCSQFLDLDCEGGTSSASPSAGEKATVLSYRARFHIELADFESALQDANASLDASDKCVLVSTPQELLIFSITRADCLSGVESFTIENSRNWNFQGKVIKDRILQDTIAMV